MTEEECKGHLKDQLFHGLQPNICNALQYMYDKPNLQLSQLVMTARMAETETLGLSALEAKAKLAVVKLEAQTKAPSSDQLYEVVTQQLAYLMSVITNQNVNNNGQNGSSHNNWGGTFS